MRVLLVHPGASWATADVFTGVRDALVRAGVEVVEYALDGRIEKAHGWLSYLWRHRKDPHLEHWTHADLLYAGAKDITERALWHQVDWVLCIAVGWLHPQALALARRAGLKVAILFTESPNEDAGQLEWAKLAHVCWTNERTSVAKFREVCPRSFYWQHAIDPAKHHPPQPPRHGGERDGVSRSGGEGGWAEAAAHDVVFVGTGWVERCELLAGVDWDGTRAPHGGCSAGVDLGLYGSWHLLGSRSKLRRYIRGGITPNELTAALYRSARIGLNLHRTSVLPSRQTAHIGGAESMNPRCYELAAAGCFFLCDERAEVRETFGDVAPTFRTPHELEELVRYYLAHPDERRERAARLPALVAGHTFDARVGAMLRELEA